MTKAPTFMFEDEIDDVFERHVGGVRAGPAAPADVIADAVRRQAFDCLVEHLDLQPQPFAVILKAARRHHAVVGDGGARVVELQHEAGVDDHAVFGAHRGADGADQVLFGLVVFVLAVGYDARGRRHRQERLDYIDAFQRRFEIVDIALQLGLAGIGDRPDAHRLDGGGDAFAGVELGIKFGELLAVDAAGKRIAARLDRPPLKTAQPFEHVLRPADRFAELAVADDVDAGFGLLVHHLRDRSRQALVISGRVVRLAGLFGAQKLLQRLAGRIRLPTWVVRMRSVLRFIWTPWDGHAGCGKLIQHRAVSAMCALHRGARRQMGGIPSRHNQRDALALTARAQ